MTLSQRDLPLGTVTFLFTDIEDSTVLAHRLDPQTYRVLLEQHHRLLREAFAAHAGAERGTQGDSFFVVFRDAPSAVAASVDAQRAISAASWPGGVALRVRMGLHTGEGIAGGDDYVGLDINRAARIAAAAHGGQVVISDATRLLTARALPDGVTVRDAGEHRLKGLERTEHLFSLVLDGLASDFPPLRSLSSRNAHLPARSTSFLGREAEVLVLDTMLARDRLITLVGPGGSGKTSLAVELARMAATRFEDGAWFVPLDAVVDPDQVASAIVTALGVLDRSNRPLRERLLENLSVRPLLLVLDNFEHLLPAAALVAEILDGAPGCRVVVTSRAPLHISSEQIYPVDPLALPDPAATSDPGRLGSSASVQLLVDRAQRVRPAFALTADNAAAIAGICHLLDGLPLGIEIAAARVALLGPAAVLDRLSRHLRLPGQDARDLPTRQRTLHDAIAWSHDLLDPLGRRTFARCSIFVGGWQLDEALTVCADPDDPDDGDVADTLLALVDQSLVITTARGDGVRFGMLETIGRFAAERFADGRADPGPARRHALAYLDVAERYGPQLGGAGNAHALRRLDEEAGNLERAVQWSVDASEVELAHRLAVGLWRWWEVYDAADRGHGMLETILSMPGADVVTAWRMRALEARGSQHYYATDRDAAAAAYIAQLRMAQELDDPKGEADARFNLLFTAEFAGRLEEGLALVDTVAAAYRELGDEIGVARCGWIRSTIYFSNGRMDLAQAELLQVVPRLHELDDVAYEQFATGNLAIASFQIGDIPQAVGWFVRSLEGLDRMGDDFGVTVALPVVAAVVRMLGDLSAAVTIHAAFASLARMYGAQMPPRLQEVAQALAPARSWDRENVVLDDATYGAALDEGSAMSVREVTAFAIATLEAILGTGPPSGPPGPPTDPRVRAGT